VALAAWVGIVGREAVGAAQEVVTALAAGGAGRRRLDGGRIDDELRRAHWAGARTKDDDDFRRCNFFKTSPDPNRQLLPVCCSTKISPWWLSGGAVLLLCCHRLLLQKVRKTDPSRLKLVQNQMQAFQTIVSTGFNPDGNDKFYRKNQYR
jgi:hypothetical protein